MVIDIMRDDPAALKACTLISRAWTKRARDLLLERVYVQTNSSLQHLSESLRKPRRRVSLDDTRELHVHDNHENPFAHIVPHFLAPHTSKISTLCLHDVKWDGLESRFHPSFFDYLPLFTSITCLAVSSCTFRSVCDLERLLAAFPKLNDVNLRDIDCHTVADPNAGYKVPSGSYRRITTVYYNSLTLRDMPSNVVASLCDWFTASPASVDMRSLTIVDEPRDRFNDQPWTEHVTLHLSSKLETLELSCCSFDAQDWSHACTKLNTILLVIRRSNVKTLRLELAVSPSTRSPCAGDMSLEDIADADMRENRDIDRQYESEISIELMRQCSALTEERAKEFFHRMMFTLCGNDKWNARGVFQCSRRTGRNSSRIEFYRQHEHHKVEKVGIPHFDEMRAECQRTTRYQSSNASEQEQLSNELQGDGFVAPLGDKNTCWASRLPVVPVVPTTGAINRRLYDSRKVAATFPRLAQTRPNIHVRNSDTQAPEESKEASSDQGMDEGPMTSLGCLSLSLRDLFDFKIPQGWKTGSGIFAG
ncbi:predicted protein [Postia placenta Mad-698-R]|uniref:Uncharacterized protein n=1 Tax=Postia placenta MAD-698-R-SB12 TaxID=670580 RepID=A0A1X6N7B9_9APHY|nr:hypothetical protein POSPLADRAFT_1138226 [Postia placenta MAD-698-R-SB12]EED83771.1 predicted protein [Postia placenta Mad-698-R]OSX64517.1 hypothetical protein POSPLADRAFT_1138226 [Postia placenta MAD-698-R-SB12]